MTVLKLGGSIITYKKRNGGLREKTVHRIAKEIHQALTLKPQKLIIVHGAGGKTHALAYNFRLQEGARTKEKIFSSFKVHQEVVSLQRKIAAIFWSKNLPVFPIQTSVLFYIQDFRLVFRNTTFISRVLSQGLIPLLHADMIFNTEKNFSILSGDTITLKCAKEFSANQILFATDVDGIYTDDPHLNKEAKLLPIVDISEPTRLIKKSSNLNTHDISGAMYGKILNIARFNPQTRIQIFNGLKPSNIRMALMGEKVGTIIQIKKGSR